MLNNLAGALIMPNKLTVGCSSGYCRSAVTLASKLLNMN